MHFARAPRTPRRRLVGLLISSTVLLALVWPRPSPATEGNDLGIDQRVLITLAGSLAEETTLPQRIASWLSQDRFLTKFAMAPYLEKSQVLAPRGQAEIFLFLVMVEPGLARLYFVRTNHSNNPNTYLVRDLSLPSGLDEMGQERIAQVAALSVMALVEGKARTTREEVVDKLDSLPPASPPQDANSQPSSPRTKSSPNPRETASPLAKSSDPRPSTTSSPPAESGNGSLRIGVGYGLTLRSDEGIWHGPRVFAAHGLGDCWELLLGLDGFLPTTREIESIKLAWVGGSFLAGAGIRARLSENYSVGGRLGVGVEMIHYESNTASDSALVRGPSDTELRPIIAPNIWFGVGAHLRAVVGGSIQLLTTHYDLVAEPERRVLGRAARFPPSFTVEYEF